jgi:hypothetical protein
MATYLNRFVIAGLVLMAVMFSARIFIDSARKTLSAEQKVALSDAYSRTRLYTALPLVVFFLLALRHFTLVVWGIGLYVLGLTLYALWVLNRLRITGPYLTNHKIALSVIAIGVLAFWAIALWPVAGAA